jgi:hypothetical protein
VFGLAGIITKHRSTPPETFLLMKLMMAIDSSMLVINMMLSMLWLVYWSECWKSVP